MELVNSASENAIKVMRLIRRTHKYQLQLSLLIVQTARQTSKEMQVSRHIQPAEREEKSTSPSQMTSSSHGSIMGI
jgi:hypothetical protein